MSLVDTGIDQRDNNNLEMPHESVNNMYMAQESHQWLMPGGVSSLHSGGRRNDGEAKLRQAWVGKPRIRPEVV